MIEFLNYSNSEMQHGKSITLVLKHITPVM